MKSLNYLMGHILYQIFKTNLTDNPPIRICVSEIENRIPFRMGTSYCFEVSMSETMKLFGSTKCKITKDENCENVPHL